MMQAMHDVRARRTPHVRWLAFFAAFMLTVAAYFAVDIFALDRSSELGPPVTYLVRIVMGVVSAVTGVCGWVVACVVWSLASERPGPRTWAAVVSGAVSPFLPILLERTHSGLLAWVAAPMVTGAVLGTIATIAIAPTPRVSSEQVTGTVDMTAFSTPAMRRGWRVLTKSERPAMMAALARAMAAGELAPDAAPHACMAHETSGDVLFELSDGRLLVLAPGKEEDGVTVFASPSEWLARLGEDAK